MHVRVCARVCVCVLRVCVRVHVCETECMHSHKGKPLSTSNQGPNQHPIAHPHNLSVSLPPLLILFSFPFPLPWSCLHILPLSPPSSPLFLPFPSSCSSLEMAAAAVLVGKTGGRGHLGMSGLEQAQLRGQLSAFPVLVVMLEGEDKAG